MLSISSAASSSVGPAASIGSSVSKTPPAWSSTALASSSCWEHRCFCLAALLAASAGDGADAEGVRFALKRVLSDTEDDEAVEVAADGGALEVAALEVAVEATEAGGVSGMACPSGHALGARCGRTGRPGRGGQPARLNQLAREKGQGQPGQHASQLEA